MMDSEFGWTMEVVTLGRPFSLGMLYDCRRDVLIPGMTLWDRDDLKKHVAERPQTHNDFEIVASESIEGKLSVLNVEASLKASFLCGLVEVDGSAKYLNDSKTSRNQARVTLKYKATTKVQELSMDHLGRGNVKHPYVFDKGLATHVVTAVLYGAQAFFVFDRDVSENEDQQGVKGKLKMIIKKIPCLSIEGKGSLKLKEEDKAKVENFSCRFYGDFSLKNMPTSFQDAVEVYQSLPKLLGANGENAVPLKVWLLPLTSLDSSAAKLVRQISISLVQEAQKVLEDLSDLDIRCNDALKETTVQQFPQVVEKLKHFKEMCSLFKQEFQKDSAMTLPLIRAGGENETRLTEILKKRHFSPFSSKNLSEWMDCKEREIYTLMSLTNMMRNTKIVPTQNHLYKESLSAEHVVCFVFTSLGSPDPHLSALSQYLRGRTDTDEPQDQNSQDVEEVQWFNSKEILDETRSKAKLFIDFAEANKEKQNMKFLTVGLKDETQKGSSIYLYKDGFSVSQNFEPPSKPETVTVRDINHNSVTLKICPPRFGAENITSYSVEFCVSGEDGWQQQTSPVSEEVTVNHLRLNTEYMFRCRAVTSVGVGPASEVSGSIKTSPCSPPRKPQVEPNSTEISVSWEKPAELGQDVQIVSYIVEYATTNNMGKEEDLQWKQMVSTAEHVIISELQPKTDYVVRVRCDCGDVGSSKESISVCVGTKTFLRLAEVLRISSKRINSESPYVCKLPLNKEMHSEGYQRFTFGKKSRRPNRTVVLFGAARSGKSSLINAMINYIVGVEWKDNFRLKITDQSRSQAESPTSDVTVYKINHQDGFKVPFSMTVVDIPLQLGETRCIEKDKKVQEQLCGLLSAAQGIYKVDVVGFVTKADSSELTPTQKYVFESVLSVFDREVTENVQILVTFNDGHHPPVLEAISASGVPCPKRHDGLPVHFKFCNSALFAHNKTSVAENTDSYVDVSISEMFWEIGTKHMRRFFAALSVMDPKSLTLTKKVLRERQRLENLVEHLQERVKLALAELEEKQKKNELRQHQVKTSEKKFEFEVTLYRPFKQEVSSSKDVFTNCQQCHVTCHYPRTDQSAVSVGPDGHCTVCPGKCHRDVHFNQKYRWDYKEVKVKHTVNNEKHPQFDTDATEKELNYLIQRSDQCLNKLKEMVDKSNPLTTEQYKYLLREGEKFEKKAGWKKRVYLLETKLLQQLKLFLEGGFE